MTGKILVVELLSAMATTRAIRRYRTDEIPESDLQTMLWAASRAPSGSNRQLFRFLVLRSGAAATPESLAVREMLTTTFQRGWVAKRATDCYEEGSGATADSPKARMAATMQHFVDNIGMAPIIVLACLERHRAPTPTEGASVFPAVQNLLLAARTLGYGGVITQWHGEIEDEIKTVLGIPAHVAIHAVIPLGRPMGNHGPVRRRPLAHIVSENIWGNVPGWAVDPDGTSYAQAGPPTG
jgi:nitroreductase